MIPSPRHPPAVVRCIEQGVSKHETTPKMTLKSSTFDLDLLTRLEFFGKGQYSKYTSYNIKSQALATLDYQPRELSPPNQLFTLFLRMLPPNQLTIMDFLALPGDQSGR